MELWFRLLELWLLVVVILHLAQVLAASSVIAPSIFRSLPLLPEVYHSHGLCLCLGAVACSFRLVQNHLPHSCPLTLCDAIEANILLVGVPRLLFLVAIDANDESVLSVEAFYDKKLDQKYEK